MLDGKGYWIEHLDGTRVPFYNPEVNVPEEEEFDTFDPEAANQQNMNDAARAAEAALAGRIVGVAEEIRKRDDPSVDTTDEGN